MKEVNFSCRKITVSRSPSPSTVCFTPFHTHTEGHHAFSDLQICEGVETLMILNTSQEKSLPVTEELSKLDEPSDLSKISVRHFKRNIQDETKCFSFVHQEQEEAHELQKRRPSSDHRTHLHPFTDGRLHVLIHSLLEERF